MAQIPCLHQGVGTRDGAEYFGIRGPLCGLLMAPKHNMCIISWDSHGFEACCPPSPQERVWKDSRLHFNMVGMGVGMEISRSL